MKIRRKRSSLSPHQQQMRFFTVLALGIIIVFTLAFFWLINLTDKSALLTSGR